MKNCKNNANFFWQNLKKKLRLDGRNFEDSRNISIYFLGEYGNVEISIGHTKVICRITSEIVKPYEKKPNEGIIKVNLDVDSFNGTGDNLKISDECLEIRNLIERILKASNLLNFESLCIIPHKKVWCLLVNIVVIENDGNLYDSCYLSAYSALVHYRNNEVKVESNGDIIIEEEETNYSPLSIHNSPILTTFAYFNSEDICLVDPSINEEEFMSSKLSVALNKNGKLISILKPGGSPISYVKILEAIELAKKRVKCILKILEDALEEDMHLRNNLKKKNLHIKYSCNPVHIKYDEENLCEKPLEIPINQSLKNDITIEKIVKKYEEHIKMQDIEQEEKIDGNNKSNSATDVENKKSAYRTQYLIDEALQKLKNENRMKNGDDFYQVDNSYENHLGKTEIDNGLHLPIKKESHYHITDAPKIKRQEFGDVNSNFHQEKNVRVKDMLKKETINFSSALSQNMRNERSGNIRDSADPHIRRGDNFEDTRKNMYTKKEKESAIFQNEDSSDIDFSIAINENLTKKKKKKKLTRKMLLCISTNNFGLNRM
ncbi:exosome complex component RRP45, putative [Plasmodium ovale]|uniref:Exosome complex component RRP45, putative n=1 Tax=Plasmodium ovale TaxID=36330 RepID=A0A1D3TIT5_PLAOA|nr:exosome complex component RRP45, putative [Plasmodium ovale]